MFLRLEYSFGESFFFFDIWGMGNGDMKWECVVGMVCWDEDDIAFKSLESRQEHGWALFTTYMNTLT